jgi:hypothetical protein
MVDNFGLARGSHLRGIFACRYDSIRCSLQPSNLRASEMAGDSHDDRFWWNSYTWEYIWETISSHF